MGFRSRALLTGVATGFLKANNDRRDRMAERMQQLSDNRATMDRERAKSRADAASKAAAEESSKWHELRSNGYIDTDGNYTTLYHDKIATAEFTKKEVREAYGNNFDAFKTEFSKMGPKKFIREYKDPNEIETSLQNIYSSIDTRQRNELQRPALTGFDAMLGSVVNRVSSAVGGGNVFGPPSDGTLDSTPTPTLDPMRTQEPVVDTPYESPNFKTPVAAKELKEVKTETDESGVVQAVKFYTDGSQETVSTNIQKGKEIKNTYLTYDEDGTEYVVSAYTDSSVNKEATGLVKPNKAGTIDIKTNDLKNPVEKLTMERIRDGAEATRLVGNILRDTSVETAALVPKAVNSIILSVQEEFVGTFGSEEQKNTKTNQALNAAFQGDLAFIDTRSEKDLQIGTDKRNELAAKVAGLKQDRLALAYALVRLNRASGRFNGQELQEQIELLSTGSLAQAASVLKRAQDQVQQSLEFDVQQAAASVVSTNMMTDGDVVSANEVLGWASKKPVRDDKNGAYYVMFNRGPYKYAHVKPNGGIVLRKRTDETK